jgi:hypothetical protein
MRWRGSAGLEFHPVFRHRLVLVRRDAPRRSQARGLALVPVMMVDMDDVMAGGVYVAPSFDLLSGPRILVGHRITMLTVRAAASQTAPGRYPFGRASRCASIAPFRTRRRFIEDDLLTRP